VYAIPSTIESLLIVLFIVAPGYIVRETISYIIPKQEKSEFENILDSIIYGFFNFLIFFIIVILFWKIGIVKKPEYFSFGNHLKQDILNIIKYDTCKFIVGILFYAFIFPILIGIGLGKYFGNERRHINPFPSAWDEFFIKTTDPVILYIILKDKSRICGIFGTKSCASTNPKQRDIYLEKEIILDQDGNIEGIKEGNTGLWVNRDDIVYFKVLPYKEE